ncbi:hypothetical protein Dimus_024655 [Dionaea muscipula]
MIVIHLKKKDIVKSKVRGIEMEFDHEKSATIPECGSCVWKKGHLKLLDLTYMDHSMSRRKINLPRVMIGHMSYVISMKDHELPYGDRLTMVFQAFGVPLVDKKGEEPKRYDFFEETFLTMCKLTKENGIWWIGSGENRRRDDDVNAQEGEAEKEDEGNKDDFDWEAVIDEAAVEGESGSGERFYDAEDETQGSPEVQEEIPPAAPQSSLNRRNKTLQSRPSVPTSREVEFPKFRADLKEKGPTGFMTIWRRPKQKMPDF